MATVWVNPGQDKKRDDILIIPFFENILRYFALAFTGSYVQKGSAAR